MYASLIPTFRQGHSTDACDALQTRLMESLLTISRLPDPTPRPATLRNTASELRAGILDLLWDSNKLAFYDSNSTSNARNDFYSAATFYPFWAGIVPPTFLSDRARTFGAFSASNLVMNRCNGIFPATFVETSLQWDLPSA